MARLSLTLSITVLSILYVLIQCELATVAAHTVANTYTVTNFITNSCHTTLYPFICVQSLLAYSSTIQTSHKQLAITALCVSVDTAQSTEKFIYKLSKFKGLKPIEYAAIKDCLDEVTFSVERLGMAVQELKSLDQARGPEFTLMHKSNLNTWVSAAMTAASTCADGFADLALDGKIKSSVRARMTNLGQVTSNALAFCNQIAAMN